MIKEHITTFILLLGALVPAHGASGPAECAALEAEDERLSCYDAFFRAGPKNQASGMRAQSREAPSPVQSRRDEEKALRNNWFSITPHRPNYILPATYNASADFSPYGIAGDLLSDSEIKFQLSLKTTLLSNLWRDSSVSVAYTQQSYWQLFADDEISAPFRETNHEPEIIWDIPVDFQLFGFQARLASLSFNHQSNGRARPLSRSWNRLTGEIVMERNRFVVSAKTWARIDDPDIDDNPNIENYMGRIQLGAAYKGDRHTLALGLKNSLDSDLRSGVEFNWMFPLTRHLKGFVQLYSGYGENLIDMENYNNRIGIGIALTDWL